MCFALFLWLYKISFFDRFAPENMTSLGNTIGKINFCLMQYVQVKDLPENIFRLIVVLHVSVANWDFPVWNM